MTPDYWIVQGQQCAWIAVLFYTLTIGSWLSNRWKERHPEWRHRLPGDHRAPTLGVTRLRDTPGVPWKVTAGHVENLEAA